MKTLLAGLSLAFFAPAAWAAEWHVMELDKFEFEIAKIADHRDENFVFEDTPKEPWRGNMATNFDLDLLTHKDYGLVWLNKVHGAGTQKQMREVGWQYRLGLEVGPKLMFFYDHHSRHLLDTSNDYKFPLDNSYGISVTFYERKRP